MYIEIDTARPFSRSATDCLLRDPPSAMKKIGFFALIEYRREWSRSLTQLKLQNSNDDSLFQILDEISYIYTVYFLFIFFLNLHH